MRVRPIARAGALLELKYGDFLEDPGTISARAGAFFGHDLLQVPVADDSRIPSIEPGDPRACAVWELCGEFAATLGYAEIPDTEQSIGRLDGPPARVSPSGGLPVRVESDRTTAE